MLVLGFIMFLLGMLFNVGLLFWGGIVLMLVGAFLFLREDTRRRFW